MQLVQNQDIMAFYCCFNSFRTQTKYFLKLLLIGITMILLVGMPGARAQGNFMWWNDKHNWDGVTHWSRYIICSPGYLGPNALPVPNLPAPVLDHRIVVEPGTGFHIQPGEFTYDGTYRLYYPIGGGLAALEVYQTFIEYYKNDTLLRDERRARNINVEGVGSADINIATYLTLFRNRRFPDMVLRINLRTSSGTHYSNARTSDAPGYFFDLAFGKSLLKNKLPVPKELKIYGILGFYVWQTNINDRRQNDALMLGFGSHIKLARHKLSAEATGYFGYYRKRDDPVVVRFKYACLWDNFSVQLQYQKGLHDIYHHSVHLTVARYLNVPERWNRIKQ